MFLQIATLVTSLTLVQKGFGGKCTAKNISLKPFSRGLLVCHLKTCAHGILAKFLYKQLLRLPIPKPPKGSAKFPIEFIPY